MIEDAINKVLRMSSWTIYRRPSDFPNHYVVREWVATGRGLVAKPEVLLFVSLDQARLAIPPGCMCLPAMAGDDSVIVETWL